MTNPDPNSTDPRFVDSTLALFAQQGESIANSEPNTGDGGDGQRPPAGEYESILEDVTWDAVEMKRRPDGLKIKAVVVRFLFTTPMPGGTDVMKWRGEPFFLPINEGDLVDENQKTQVRIAKERLAGHIASLLGRPASKNTGADMLEIKKLATGPSKLLALVSCNWRQSKDKKYFSEYIRTRVSP